MSNSALSVGSQLDLLKENERDLRTELFYNKVLQEKLVRTDRGTYGTIDIANFVELYATIVLKYGTGSEQLGKYMVDCHVYFCGVSPMTRKDRCYYSKVMSVPSTYYISDFEPADVTQFIRTMAWSNLRTDPAYALAIEGVTEKISNPDRRPTVDEVMTYLRDNHVIPISVTHKTTMQAEHIVKSWLTDGNVLT